MVRSIHGIGGVVVLLVVSLQEGVGGKKDGLDAKKGFFCGLILTRLLT